MSAIRHKLNWRLGCLGFTLIVLLGISGNAPAAPSTAFSFEKIHEPQGMHQSTLWSIVQDARGFMWFGAEVGLYRHDGYTFKAYAHDPADPKSLSSSYILSLFVDKTGSMWIGTLAGLNRFDPTLESFERYEFEEGDPNTEKRINVIHQDRTGVLWLGTERGIVRFDPHDGQSRRFRHHSTDPHSLCDDHITAIDEDATGRLWIGTAERGLCSFDPATDRFTHHRRETGDVELSADRVQVVMVDSQSNIWVGTNLGLSRFDPNRSQFTLFRPYEKGRSIDNWITAIREARNGQLMVGTQRGGLYTFDQTVLRFSPLASEDTVIENKIMHIYEDCFGVVWICTHGEAIYKGIRQKPFRTLKFKADKKHGLSHQKVFTFHQEPDETLMIGTGGAGIDMIHPRTGQIRNLRHDANDPQSLSSDYIRQILKDSTGTIWIATEGGGLNIYDRRTEKFTHIRHDPADPKSLSNDYVYCAFEDHTGALWFGTRDGLNRLNRHEMSFHRYYREGKNGGSLSSDYVYAIDEDRGGTLWIGTLGGGLNRFNREDETFSHYAIGDNIAQSYESETGQFWVATNTGLVLLNRATGEYSRFTQDHGLSDNVVFSILEDHAHILWLGTSNGLTRFNPRTNEVHVFDKNDGLFGNEFNGKSKYKTPAGELFLGGINGFSSFFPERITVDQVVPDVVLTDALLFNKSIPLRPDVKGQTHLQKSIIEADQLTLNYDDTVVSFEFAALHFADPPKNQYAYMMEGFDKNWSYVGDRRFATYTNLPPGQYSFRVRGSNADGVWNEQGISLRIEVVPPVWQTWWFKAMIVIAVLGTAIGLYKMRISTIAAQKMVLQTQVENRTKQLAQTNLELEKLSIVARKTENAVMIMDERGTIEWINEGFTRMYGLTLEELLAQKGSNLAQVSNHPEIGRLVNECKTIKRSVTYETVNISLNDRVLCTQSTITPMIDEQDNLVKLIAIDTDITELKKSQRQAVDRASELKEVNEKLATANERLRDLDKMKSRFFANISHDLRTPLTLILAPLELMLSAEAGPLTEEQTDQLDGIRRSAMELLKLINDLLDLSRLEETRMTLQVNPVDLSAHLNRLTDFAQPLARRKNIELKLAVDEGIKIDADEDKLERALVNLLSNALKFTDAEGTVSITARTIADYAQVEIKDTGIGIPEDALSSVFDRFGQVDPSITKRRGGSGIGLSLAKEFVELHRGRLTVTSKLGEGSAFLVEIPIGLSSQLSIHPTPQATPEGPSTDPRESEKPGIPEWTDQLLARPEYRFMSIDKATERRSVVPRTRSDGFKAARILIADDNAEVLKYVQQLLLDKYDVWTAEDGQQAWDLLVTHRHDLVIADVMMPKMSGLELCKRIKVDARTQDTPVILLTARGDVEHRVEGEAMGADKYFTKPFNQRELRVAISNLLEGRARRMEAGARKRSATVETLLSGMAHELHNACQQVTTALSAYWKLAKKGSTDKDRKGAMSDAELVDRLHQMEGISGRALERITTVVKSLSQYAQNQMQVPWTDLDLDELIAREVNLITGSHNKGIELKLLLQSGATIRGPQEEIRQMVLNIVENAVQAVDVGGIVEVGTSLKQGKVCLRVCDNGCGIPADQRERVFDPFFTTKTPGKGMGLGLALCKRTVIDLGGTIELKTNEGVGTEVYIELPRTDFDTTTPPSVVADA